MEDYLDKVNNIMMIEFNRKVAGSYVEEMVAIYNKSKISEKDVRRVIQEGVYSDKVIIIPKKQYRNVFFS